MRLETRLEIMNAALGSLADKCHPDDRVWQLNADYFRVSSSKLAISVASYCTFAFSQVTRNAVTSLKNSKCFNIPSLNGIIIIIIITSTSDLQPSTAIANQLPGQ